MLHSSRTREGLIFRMFWRLLVAFALLSCAACSKKEQPTPSAMPAALQTFASPDAAGKALMEAAKSQSQDTMLAIFGTGSKDLIYWVILQRTRRRWKDLCRHTALSEPLAGPSRWK